MEEPAREASPTRVQRWSWAAAAGCVGLGVALLLCGIGLAVWSLYWATSTALPERNLRWDRSTPGLTAWWSIIVALVVVFAVVRGYRRAAWGMATFVAIGVGILLVGSGVVPSGLAANYSKIMSSYAPAQQVPSALSAWLLASAGTVAVLIGAFALIGVLWRGRAPLAVGAVIGVVAAVVVTVVAMRDADPDRLFDATTAAETATPSTPAALGLERFTVHLDPPEHGHSRAVRAAGPGFAVGSKDGVRAYDSSGRERWHYVSSGATSWELGDFRVFDEGRTVVALFDSGGRESGIVVGLDAMTGRLLWRSDDTRIVLQFDDYAQRVSLGNDDAMYLTVWNGSDLTRLDSRTGRKLWNTRAPNDAVPMDTGSGVGYFAPVEVGDRVELRYVSLDPQTGDTRFDVVASAYRPDEDSYDRVRKPVHAGRDGVVFGDAAGRTHYLNGVTGAVSPFDGEVLFGTVDADEFVAEQYRKRPDADVTTLRGQPDGRARCTLPTGAVIGSTAWLGDLVLSTGDSGDVVAYRRSDCTAVPRNGVGVPSGTVVVTPGAVLVVNGDQTEITGYA